MLKLSDFFRYFVIFVLLFLTGCIAYPAKGLKRCGIQGKLVDKATGSPLSEKEICVTVKDETFRLRTSNVGTFKISPDYEWYLTWTISGPVMGPYPVYEVEINALGHDKLFLFSSLPSGPDCPDNYIEVPFQISDDSLLLGNQYLIRHEKLNNQ